MFKKHPVFERHGADIYIQIEITLPQPLWEAKLMSLDWTAETNWRYQMELKQVQRLESRQGYQTP